MSRRAHESGDCWDGCQFCEWEDERAAAEADTEDDGNPND